MVIETDGDESFDRIDDVTMVGPERISSQSGMESSQDQPVNASVDEEVVYFRSNLVVNIAASRNTPQ